MQISILKKNQIIISVLALMLVTVGYLNFTNTADNTISTSSISLADSTENIGDATLVSSNAITENNTSVLEENVNITESEDVNAVKTNNKVADDYFINSRLEREKMYSQTIESYQKMYENQNVTSEQKAIAVNEITKINKEKNAIMIAENLIKNKEVEDIIIFVNDLSINVVVKSEELSTEIIAQIQNIIARELNAAVENIHISNK